MKNMNSDSDDTSSSSSDSSSNDSDSNENGKMNYRNWNKFNKNEKNLMMNNNVCVIILEKQFITIKKIKIHYYEHVFILFSTEKQEPEKSDEPEHDQQDG
jgi:type IV secretory pathway TraG/TraD family ATPase VirD4